VAFSAGKTRNFGRGCAFPLIPTEGTAAMPNPGLAMPAIKEILRLRYEARLSQREIAHSLGLSVGVVSKYLRRARARQITWPLPAEWTAAELLQRLGGAGAA
jgi:hypothetical protein